MITISKKMKYFWIFAGCMLMLSVSIFLLKRDQKVSSGISDIQYKNVSLTMGGETFNAQISDTPILQERGLSYRKSIGQNEAMIFVFSRSEIHKFWMKDMNFPIDIIWLDSLKKIIYIEKNVSPGTFPKTFGSQEPSQYVIEVASGTVDRLGLSVSDQMFLI